MSERQTTHDSPGTATETPTFTPDDVQSQYQDLIETLGASDETPPLLALVTPENRGRILYELLGASEPLTAGEICDRAAIDRSTFGPHIDVLQTAGVVHSPGKKGNARVYVPNFNHPVTQLLKMTELVQRTGYTPDLLDEAFVGDPAAEK